MVQMLVLADAVMSVSERCPLISYIFVMRYRHKFIS